MTSLKDKGYECEELGAKYSYVDVKEAVLKDIENMEKLEYTVIMAFRFRKDNDFNNIDKIIEELSRYKNSKFKVFGDFENDL